MHGDSPTHGVAATKVSHHKGEKVCEGLTIGHGDVTDYRPGENPNGLSEQRGTRILEYTQNLGGVITTTTNGELLAESSISVNITTIV